MWILSAEGDVFKGHRKWLRPGTKHLLGRISTRQENGENLIHISHKSVSRKHILLEVGPVKPGASAHLHARSEVRITDSSKTGTRLNGDSFTNSTRIVGESGGTFDIKLGSSGPALKLQWVPVVLTFTNLPKGTTSKQNILTPHRAALEPADVKIVTEYVSNVTTHVVAKKRNNAQSLQALTQARWLVSEAFVDALKAVVQKQGVDGNGEPLLESLEQDFDSQWPQEIDFPTSVGREPQPRPDHYLAPNAQRAEVFEDYVFIFLVQHQYENLLPVVTSGGGKAMCWELTKGESKVADLLAFVKEVVGHKEHDSFNLSQQTGRGGAVIVRIPEAEGIDDWWQDFNKQIQQDTGQRSIDQAEFLDAILTADASTLRRPLEVAEGTSPVTNGTSQIVPSISTLEPQPQPHQPPQPSGPPDPLINAPESPSEEAVQRRSSRSSQHLKDRPGQRSEETQPPYKRQRRLVTQSRFKGFDDFDPSQYARPESDSDEPPTRQSQREDIYASNADYMDVGDRAHAANSEDAQQQRRSAADEADEDEARLLDSMLRGRNELKRKRTDGSSLMQSKEEAEREVSQQAAKPRKRKEKEVDIKEELLKNRQKQDEDRRQYEDTLRQALDGIDINELTDVAKVEVIEVSDRPSLSGLHDTSGRNGRWDPSWNGRKNYKKFRPKGQARDAVQPRRVIVPLEEVPKETYGLGDSYWTSTPVSHRGRSKSKSQSQSVHQVQSTNDEGDDLQFRRRIEASREQDVYDYDDDALEPDGTAGQPRGSRMSELARSTASQTLRGTASQTANGKRPAVDQAGPASKRTKQSRLPRNVNIHDDNDDDDGLEFRRRRR